MSKKTLPFGGEISRFYESDAPAEIREAIAGASKDDILGEAYPYPERMEAKLYEKELYRLQIELAKFQTHVQREGLRVVVLFEGRDAAGKGGTIKRFRENMNPRVARVVALSAPSPREQSQFYLQRYMPHLPAAGEITLFDRSWYNRGVVEKVFGFCSTEERARFFRLCPNFETALIEDGIHLVKLWLTVSRAEQLRRFLAREQDPLKQWKLSQVDVDGLKKWDDYGEAIRETFDATHTVAAPWTVIRSDDKRRARIAAIRSVLHQIPYAGRDEEVACAPDPQICGGPDLFHA
ncbi:polyphosphate kinase 2 [Mangrovicoccus algicola]|uniref:ADP/GDP-polyphosphate phosphotransferase n=1 Tax=Mangrovicoccus algicola TaxID=2771008 RepID=A0A8J7CGY4_9RHOB|nr:polyphosphate kinase 2 [Mangrovicoccus algicola]MBE3637650.1 polyphosphate kinase 2 [Mangrovicoccus algicola]